MATVWILLACSVLHLTSGSLVNVAQGKPVLASSMRSGYNASTAVDGNISAGSSDESKLIYTLTYQSSAWWKVDLQRDVSDATVRIYFRTDYPRRRNGVELYTSTSDFTEYPGASDQLCHTVTGSAEGIDIPSVYNVTCPGRWRYLLLYTDTYNDNMGAILDFGEVEVLVCSDDTYGEDCTKTCISRNCVTKTTTCEIDGRCPDGCQSGWTGVDCTQVLPPCQDNNYYGLNCDKPCSDRKCTAPSTSSCDRLTGRCPDGCEAGWRQEDCTQECATNLYGPSCSWPCTYRRCVDSSSPCDHVTGQCVGGCQTGYKGTDCTQACDNPYYGPGCSLSCTDRKCVQPSSDCNHVTGRCVNGCGAGYQGTDCTAECDSGFYGSDCSLSCSARHCSDSSSLCDHVTGQCVGGCQTGYTGTDCGQECLSGKYGVNCEKSCIDRPCVTQSTVCDRQTGQCPGGCQSGWRGVDCTSQCPAGTFGSDCTSCSTRHCQGESDCPADGTCSQGCQDGWSGNTCTQACRGGNFGPGCSSRCGQCIADNICNFVTGNCPGDCQAGWRGPQCQQECGSGQYGVNCAQRCGQCNGTCDRVLGHCPDGCLHGFCGLRCEVELADTGNQQLVVPIVSAALGSALLVLLLCVGIYLCLVRQGRLQWVKHPENKKPGQVSRDSTQMSNIARQATDVSEHAQSTSHMPINDYDVLDPEQMQGNKHYDVIKHKEYQNA